MCRILVPLHLLLFFIGSIRFGECNKGRHQNSVDLKSSPLFDTNTVQEVTTTVGQTAFLHCRVRYLGDRRVLWMRQRDLHILTSSLHTYTNDLRISAVHSIVMDTEQPETEFLSTSTATWEDRPNKTTKINNISFDTEDEEGMWSEWTLRIRSAQVKDAGLYECQVSTEPKISRIYRLNVVVSKANILGSSELFVKKGSDINLTCVALQAPEPPLHFNWFHNGQVLNYSARGGLSVTTDKSTKLSRLLVARADTKDSGNYSCVPTGAHPASVIVHVLNGEQPAAMQRDNSANLGYRSPCCGSCLIVLILMCYVHRILADST